MSYQTALAQFQLGLLDRAERTLELARRQYPNDVLCYPIAGLLAARRGEVATADEQIELTIRNRKLYGHYHHAQYDIACIHALVGRQDEALEWLTDAARNGFPCWAFFERDPLLDRIRTDARFRGLLEELRAECERYRTLYAELGPRGSSSTQTL